MADENLLDLPEDIDERIAALARENRALTPEMIVRDIARLHCLIHLVKEGTLGDEAVLTGGIAMRCLNSRRFSIYDSDTSSIPELSDSQLVAALNYGDDDITVSIARIAPQDHGKDLVSAHPIEFDPRFSRLMIANKTFKLTVSHRGVERPAQWLEPDPGYPFALWKPERDYRVPVMATNELLAEKLAAWWIFAPAKHYADIAYLGACLFRRGLVTDEATKLDIRELVEIKLDRNRAVSRTHRQRVDALDEDERRRRLLEPARYVDPEHAFNRLSFFGVKPPSADSMQSAVARWVEPLLFG